MKEVTLSKIIGENGVFVDGDWIESKDQDANGDVRLIQLADIGDGVFINKSNRFLTSEKAKELKCTFLKQGDLLIARMPDPLGRACIFPGLNMPCITVVDICIVRPDANIADHNWLKFLINSYDFRNKINRYITGTTRQRISRGNLEKLSFQLPQIFFQLSIAKLLTKAENLIAKRKESIQLLDEFLKSTFLEMFGDPVRNEKDWKTKTIEYFAKKKRYSLKRGPFGGALKKEIFTPSGYLVYEQYHALNNDFSFERYYIDEKKFQELKAFEVAPDDIIISCSGVYLGKLAIVPKGAKKGIINQALLKVTLDDKIINNHFFVFMFSHESFKNKFYGNFIGSGIPNFPSMIEFKRFLFIYPPFELQTKFAQIVEKTESLKTQYHQSLRELENLYGSLSQKAFRGELSIKEEGLMTAAEPKVTYTGSLLESLSE